MPISDYTPTIDDVASILRARTRNEDGDLVGTFDTTTEPTGDDVEELISQAASEVSFSVGTELPNEVLNGSAQQIVTLLAAMNVEMSYFPDQVSTARSPYEALERRFNKGLDRLIIEVEEAGGGDGGEEGVGAASLNPSGDFPVSDGYLGRRW